MKEKLMKKEIEDFINNILNGEEEQSKINFSKFIDKKTAELLSKRLPVKDDGNITDDI